MYNKKFQPWLNRRTAAARVARAPIDREHLGRMTVGNRELEREILDLFDQQIRLLVARMHHADPAALGALAHTLKGSARNIGAWELADATEQVDAAAAAGRPLGEPFMILAAAAARVRRAIAEMRQNEAGADAAL